MPRRTATYMVSLLSGHC